MSFDTGISQSDISKYIADFENDKKIFYNEWMICIVNFVKNQNIKVETDNLWIGIKREISEINQEKLIGMLNYKGLIRTLQGAYKVLDIPYLTLLNSTLLNSTWPDKVFEEHFIEEIQETENTDDKEIQNTKLSDEWIALLEWEETFTSIIAQALIDIWWKPKETVQEFVEWVKKKMEVNKIEECEKDFYKLKSGLSSFVDHFSNLKVKNHKATLWSNFCLRFNLK